MSIKLTSLLKEYSDKTIKSMVELYKTQTQDSEEQIKSNIKRFQQLTDSIGKKLKDKNPLMINIIPKEFQDNNKFRDITLYKNYDLLLKVLKSADSKPVDVYKQAIERFKKQDEYTDPRIFGNYVARFKQNLPALIQRVEAKDRETLSLVPKDLIKGDAYKNILNWWDFHTMEHMLDALFPYENKGGDDNANDATGGTDLVYKNESDGIEVYKGDEEHKCIKYSKGYSWCIGNTMYSSYRYRQSQGNNRLFYFVFDRTQPKDNKYHVCVIHAFENGKYKFTNAKNSPGEQPYEATSWKNLGEEMSKDKEGKNLWNKIKDLQSYFKFIPPNRDELRRLGFKGKNMSLDTFATLDPEDKRDWLRANATDRNIVTPEIVKALPPFGEVSKNDLINYDRIFSFDELKSNLGLLKRYPDYRFTRHMDEPLPYEFITYLKEDLQKLYYDKFEEEYLTFDEIEKYFSKDILNSYINKQLNKFDFLPDEAKKYMDKDQKDIFDIYSTVYKDIEYYGMPSEKDTIAPARRAIISDLSYKTFNSIDPSIRKKFVEMLRNIGSNIKNINKYNPSINDGGFFTGMPVSFEYNGKLYFLMPVNKISMSGEKSKDDNKYAIVDENGSLAYSKYFNSQPVLKNNGKELRLYDALSKQTGNKTYWVNQNEFDEIEADGKSINLKELKESSYDRNMLQVRSRIIR